MSAIPDEQVILGLTEANEELQAEVERLKAGVRQKELLMTKPEVLKILEEIMDSMRNEYSANEIQMQDWEHDLQKVLEAVDEGWE